MLPDLRVVTIAVISTFLVAVSVGFYTSSRLVNERKPRPDSLAAIEDHPLNRIALNWPEPVQSQSNSLDLDFAVSAKVLRNPVRDVSDDQIAAPAPEPKVAAVPSTAIQNDFPEGPVAEAPKLEAPKLEMPKPEVAQLETPKIDIVTAPPAPVAPQAKPDEEVSTASIIEAPRVNLNTPGDGARQAPEPAAEPPAMNIASRPGPDALEPHPESGIQGVPTIKPASAKPAPKKAAKKRAKKTAKVAPRPRPRIVTTTSPTNSLFPFFGLPN
jgi:hypothetical protein